MKNHPAKKLLLKPDTMRNLTPSALRDVAGGKPVTTHDLPCLPPPSDSNPI